MKKKVVLPATVALAVLAATIVATNSVLAQDATSYPSIVQKIAERFNLNEADVQSVFDEEREEKHAEMFALFADRLDELVSDGEITSEQKEAILDKHEEMQAKMEELRGLSHEERHEKMVDLHEEFRAWAEAQGLDLSLLRPLGHGLRFGFHNGYMMGVER